MSSQAGPGLQRSLSLLQATLYGLGVTIGAGIYVLVGAAAARAGMHAPLAFLLAALLMALSAASFAELAGRLPVAAGEAAYVREAFRSDKLATGIGLLVVAIAIVAAAAISLGAVGYIGVFLALPEPVLVTGVVVAMGAIAAWGINASVSFAGVMTVIEIGGLIMLILVGMAMEPDLVRRLPEALPPLSRRPRHRRHRRHDAAGRLRLHRLRGPGQRGRGGARPQAHAASRHLPDAGDFHPALRAGGVGRARLGGSGGARRIEGAPGAGVRAADRRVAADHERHRHRRHAQRHHRADHHGLARAVRAGAAGQPARRPRRRQQGDAHAARRHRRHLGAGADPGAGAAAAASGRPHRAHDAGRVRAGEFVARPHQGPRAPPRARREGAGAHGRGLRRAGLGALGRLRQLRGAADPRRRAVGVNRSLLAQAAAAVDQQADAGDEVGLVGGQEQGRVGHVPAGAHALAQRHAGVARGFHLGARRAPLRTRVSTAIGVFMRPGRMELARTPNSAFCWPAAR